MYTLTACLQKGTELFSIETTGKTKSEVKANIKYIAQRDFPDCKIVLLTRSYNA